MQDGTTDPVTSFSALPTLARDNAPILQEATSNPAPVPATSDAASVPGTSSPAPLPVALSMKTGPTSGRRGMLWLGIACGLGLALGILVTNTINNMLAYTTFYPLQSNKTSVQVFNDLNEMRQEINQLNEQKKQQEQAKQEQNNDDAIRQALNAVKSVAPDNGKPAPAVPPENGKPGPAAAPEIRNPLAGLPVMNPGGGVEARPARKANDPFADIDEEIERLEKTQKTLNKILDLFGKGQEQPKDR
jgi:hypothetical protein